MLTRRTLLGVLALVAGTAATVLGVSLVFGYVRGAVLDRLGEADQSLLFWYLPLLLFGAPLTAAGLAAVAAAVFLRYRRHINSR